MSDNLGAAVKGDHKTSHVLGDTDRIKQDPVLGAKLVIRILYFNDNEILLA